jgi:hypothetical protein
MDCYLVHPPVLVLANYAGERRIYFAGTQLHVPHTYAQAA